MAGLEPRGVRFDYTFVTDNRSDFLRHYARVDLHSGLVIIIPNVKGSEQAPLLDRALDLIESQDDIVNKVIEVHVDGSVHVKDWSSYGT